MDATTIITVVLIWVSGALFGMGLEEKLARRKEKRNRNNGTPKPFPMGKVKPNNRSSS